MKCPHCSKETDYANYTETTIGFVRLGKTNKEENTTIIEGWEEDETNKETDFSCPNCGEDITPCIKIA